MAESEFLEYGDKEVVDILCKLSITQFNEINEKFYNKSQEDEPDRAKQYRMIQNLCREFKSNNYTIKTKYSRREPNLTEGRRYANTGENSLQRIWAVYRNAIVSSKCIDIDMKNAHPSIFLKLCKDKNIPCPKLKKYVKERNRIVDNFIVGENLNSIIENANTYVKISVFIKSINYDKPVINYSGYHHNHPISKKTIKNKFFLDFDKEMKRIQKAFISHFPKEYATITKFKKNDNDGGRLMSYIGTKYEDILLEKVLCKIKSPAVLMYDGFLIHKEAVTDIDDFISKCDEITKGWVSWSQKPIKDEIITLLKELDISDHKCNIIETTTLAVANQLLKEVYNGKLVNCKDELYFKSNYGWVSNMKALERQLKHEITELDCHIQKKDGDIVFIGDSLAWCKQIVEWLISKAPKNDNLINDIWEQTTHKLHFNNGVYNFKDGSFNLPDYNTFIKIDRDFNPEGNEDIRNQIYKRILDPIFSITPTSDSERTELRDFCLKKFARIMCGHIEDKEWLGFLGSRNCGKGVISDLMKLTFENYVGSSNAENFLLNNRNEEEAKANSFMHDFQFKRLIVCNEVSLKAYGATIFDGNKIKKAHSGGDFIEMRQLYKEKTNCRFQATVLFNLNDMPQFKPSDCLEKCLQFELNSKFVKPDEKKQWVDGKKPFSNIEYIDADDWIKTHFIKQPEVQNEWFLILLDAYKTNCVFPENLRAIQIEDRDVDDINDVLKLFEITRNVTDTVTHAELKTVLRDKKVIFTFAKIKKLLVGKGCECGKNKKDRFLTGILIKS